MATDGGGRVSPGDVLAGRYRLGAVLGRGGMAEVHAARDTTLDRDVAVKVMLPQFGRDERFLQRFEREARSAAGLNHPNIVAVHDAGDDHGLPFIVMELVPGRSLDEVGRDLPSAEIVRIASEVCGALEVAHGAGIVHRDIKPGNVLVTDDGAVKVADFGIARAVDADTITMTSVFGTAAYLSPEQAGGDPVDARSDLYSLGVVLYELVTGAPPFTGGSPVQVALRHIADTPTPPREAGHDLSEDLELVILKALAKDPDDRYGSAAAMREDLHAVQRGETGRLDRAAILAAATGLGTAAADPGLLGTADETVPVGAPTGTAHAAPQREDRRTAAWLPYLALAAVGLLALAALLVRGGDGGPVAVPAVAGLTVEEATAELEAVGLGATEVARQPDATVAAEHVIATDPPIGSEVEPGTTVGLTVSAGPPPPPPTDEEGDGKDEDDEGEGDKDEDGKGEGKGGGKGKD